MSKHREAIYEGKSNKSFADAAAKAFDRYKTEVVSDTKASHPIKFRVVDMYITASNPIHDYIVELEQIQP